MMASGVEAEWKIVAQYLPANWKELARSTGALRRARGIGDADTLLRLILLHAAEGLSLRQTVARAKIAGLAAVSDVALLKRMRAAEPWLRELTKAMLERSRYALRLSPLLKGHRLRVVDATTVEEPGATGTSWRVHYALSLPSLECDFFQVTGDDGGETYRRIPVRRGDLILGDRGYAQRQGVAYVVHHEGDVLVRVNSTSFPLLDAQGRPVNLLAKLRRLVGHKPGEWAVQIETKQGRIPGRLCAIRRSPSAAAQAQKRAKRRASKQQHAVRPETLEMATYVAIFTTVRRDLLSTWQILELYRVRWQIELAFKRLKSLFNAGHVPKYDERSARAWIQAKLLAVLLIERLMEEAQFFSPWGFPLPISQPLA